jgi:hypothetical protein
MEKQLPRGKLPLASVKPAGGSRFTLPGRVEEPAVCQFWLFRVGRVSRSLFFARNNANNLYQY